MPYNNIPIIVALWEHINYEGRRVLLTEDTPSLEVYGFNDKASAIAIHPGPNYVAGTKYEISFYEYFNYGGGQLILTGPAAYPSLVRPYCFSDVISSVNFNQGAPIPNTITPIPLVVELYEKRDFGGKKLIVVENIPNLHTYSGFGDIVSSAKVMEGPNFVSGKKAKLCVNVGGSGGCIELPPGSYPRLHEPPYRFEDVCSSVYINY